MLTGQVGFVTGVGSRGRRGPRRVGGSAAPPGRRGSGARRPDPSGLPHPPHDAHRAGGQIPHHRLLLLGRLPGGCGSSRHATGCRTGGSTSKAGPRGRAVPRGALGVAPEETPVVILRGETVLRNPSTPELATGRSGSPRHGCSRPDATCSSSGPDRLAWRRRSTGRRRASRRWLWRTSRRAARASTSSRIENYLGFPAGLSGGELAERAGDPGRQVRCGSPRPRTGLPDCTWTRVITSSPSGRAATIHAHLITRDRASATGGSTSRTWNGSSPRASTTRRPWSKPR